MGRPQKNIARSALAKSGSSQKGTIPGMAYLRGKKALAPTAIRMVPIRILSQFMPEDRA